MGFKNYDESLAFLDTGAELNGCRNWGFDELGIQGIRVVVCCFLRIMVPGN